MTQIIQPKYFQEVPIDFLIGGKVYVYDAGTSNLRKSYPTTKDAEADTNPNTNPVVLDSRGEANLVIKGPTKLTLKDSNDTLIWTIDNLDVEVTDILDSNNNELITFEATANAVNHFDIRNSSTPRIKAKGSDNNIGITIEVKANGEINVTDLTTKDVSTATVTINTGDMNVLSGDFTVDSISGSTSNLIPVAVVTWVAEDSVPSGWLECDGSAVSRTTYSDLFDTIGTTFGVGDGSTTFNLPNQERRVLVGKGGTGTGTLSNTLGATGGAETHTLTESETPAHTHDCPERANLTNGSNGATFIRQQLPLNGTGTTGSTGGGSAHNILQPSLVAMMVIKT